jgi:hypothetical protein
MDRIFLLVFGIAVTVSMCAFLRVSVGAEGIDRDVHESVVRALESQIEAQRYEAGIIIASMASAITLPYVNERKDRCASRAVISRLATALDRLPCRPELCTNPSETESEVS